RRRGLLAVCDNTFASPWIQRPLEHGFDIVVHSTTKYINGHSDVIGGAAIIRQDEALKEKLAFLQNAVGGVPSPFDAFLTLRGVESLIEHPAIMTHASLPEDVRAELGIDEGLVRLSVGIENVDDLVAELKYALE